MRTRSIGVVMAFALLGAGLSCSAPATRRDGAAGARDDAIEVVDLSALQDAYPDPATPGFGDLHGTAANACARTMTADGSRSPRDPPAVLQAGSLVQLIQRKGDRIYEPTPLFVPRSLRAPTPDTVRHVVCVLETESQVGVYVAEGTNRVVQPAMQTGWDIAILTWPAGRLVDAQFLQGQLPSSRITSSGASVPGSLAPGGTPLHDQARDFLLRRLHRAKPLMEKPEWTKWTLAAAFSPDGSRLALGAEEPHPDSEMRPTFTTRIIRASDGAVLRSETSRDVMTMTGLGFSPDGRTLAVSLLSRGEERSPRNFDVDRRLVLQDSETGTIQWTIPNARFLAYSRDGVRLAAHSEGGIDIWNVTEQRRERTLVTAPYHAVPSADFSTAGEIAVMAVASDPFPEGRGRLQVFEVSTGKQIGLLDLAGKRLSLEARSPSPDRPSRLVQFLNDGRLSFQGWNSLEVWDWKSGRRTEFPLPFAAWTPELRRAVWYRGLYDLSQRSQLAELPGGVLLLSPSGSRLLGLDNDQVKLYFMPDTTR